MDLIIYASPSAIVSGSIDYVIHNAEFLFFGQAVIIGMLGLGFVLYLFNAHR